MAGSNAKDKPVKRPPATNWKLLKREFLSQDEYGKPRTWLREVKKWSKSRVDVSGRTGRMIEGWGAEWEKLQLEKTEALVNELRVAEAKRVPELLKAKSVYIAKLVGDMKSWDSLSKQDKELVWKVLKTEVGEPTVITKNEQKHSGHAPVLVEFVGEDGDDSETQD